MRFMDASRHCDRYKRMTHRFSAFAIANSTATVDEERRFSTADYWLILGLSLPFMLRISKHRVDKDTSNGSLQK